MRLGYSPIDRAYLYICPLHFKGSVILNSPTQARHPPDCLTCKLALFFEELIYTYIN